MTSNLARMVLESPTWLPLPICGQVGTQLTGSTVKDIVSSPQLQVEAILALQEYLELPLVMTVMDLSIEAELYGCEIIYGDDEIPTVVSTPVRTPQDVQKLSSPQPGDGRSRVSLEAVNLLVKQNQEIKVLGCMIGPYSLAIRLLGANEALEMTATAPEILDTLLEKIIAFQITYARAFRHKGACGVLVAEPAAGLLSPRAMSRFSSHYVRQLITSVQDQFFTVIVHNCGAKNVHLPALFEIGAEIYHFGIHMDLEKAFHLINERVILAGNLDPFGTFIEGNESDVEIKTKNLIKLMSNVPNFIPSSGCDLPAHTPLRNIKTFIQVARSVLKKII